MTPRAAPGSPQECPSSGCGYAVGELLLGSSDATHGRVDGSQRAPVARLWPTMPLPTVERRASQLRHSETAP